MSSRCRRPGLEGDPRRSDRSISIAQLKTTPVSRDCRAAERGRRTHTSAFEAVDTLLTASPDSGCRTSNELAPLTSRPPIQSGTSRACRRATEVAKSRPEERGTAEGRVRREIMVGGRRRPQSNIEAKSRRSPGHTCFSSVDAQPDSNQQESQVAPLCGRKRCTRGVRASGVEQGTVISTSESYERRCWQRLKRTHLETEG